MKKGAGDYARYLVIGQIFLEFYFSRFTEELFAVLIAFIFIFNAFRSIAQIGTDNIFMPNRLGQGCKLDKYDTDVFKFNVSMDQCQLQNGTTIDYDMIGKKLYQIKYILP